VIPNYLSEGLYCCKIPYEGAAIIYIETFTFLDHKKTVHTHDGLKFCYLKCGAKYLAKWETGSEIEKSHCLSHGIFLFGVRETWITLYRKVFNKEFLFDYMMILLCN